MTRPILSRQSMVLIAELKRSLDLAREHGAGSPEKLLLALSGGRDSMALLEALLWLREDTRDELVVAHFDHRLRENSALDREFVQSEAERHGVPCIVRIADERPLTENIEAWARAARYDFLERVRQREGASLILTAHHRDDEAETFLFRVLSGRLATRASGVRRFDRERRLLRPWLSISRGEIDGFVSELGIPFREDESNLQLERTRNRLRQETIPLLERDYNPNLKSACAEISERLTQDEEFLFSLARAEAETLSRGWNEERFRRCEAALRWRILGELARIQHPELERDLGYRKMRLLEEQILTCRGEGFELAVGNNLRAEYSRLGGVIFLAETPADGSCQKSDLR